MILNRLIPLEGGQNFRDLGGYPTRSGEQTRTGLIYRSGALSKLTDADRDSLRALGIRKGFDLRHPHEQEQEGLDDLGDGAAVILVPTTLGIAAIREQIMRDARAFRIADFYCSSLQERAEYHADLFKRIVRAMDNPLVIHCSAGKDRTGIVSALLLRVAGASDEDIIADYAATEHYLEAYAEMRREEFRGYGMPEYVIDEMLGAPPRNMEVFLAYLDDSYGSAENYLLQGGITEDDIAAFRHKFLQPGLSTATPPSHRR